MLIDDWKICPYCQSEIHVKEGSVSTDGDRIVYCYCGCTRGPETFNDATDAFINYVICRKEKYNYGD